MKSVKTRKIQITTIHYVHGSRIVIEVIEHGYVVCLSVRNHNGDGDIAPKVQERVKFDGPFVFAKLRPWKERKAKVYDRGIEGVGSLVQLDSERFLSIE